MRPKVSTLECETLLDFVNKWAEEKKCKNVFTFLGHDGEEKENLTYAQLREKSLSIAAALQEKGAAGQRVILFFQPGLEFVCAFLGCLYAKAVAVPIPPPQGKRQIPRVNSILENADPMLILSTLEVRHKLQSTGQDRGLATSYSWLDYEEICDFPHAITPEILGEDIAFLQYTSGSTSLPKGVIVNHANIIQNEQIIAEAFEHDQETVVVGWLPFYHDMGLIGNILQPIYLGASCVLMSPLTFLTEPIQWLRAISHYKATTSGGPNFAYQLCATKIADEDLQGLDLSAWKIAYNGSEPVHAHTLKLFSEKFGNQGFDSKAFYPCYGMAECTLFATGGKAGEISTISKFKPENNLSGREVDVVSCGYTRQNESVRIVDPSSSEEISDESVGEIWLDGQSIAQGYWNRPEITKETFHAHLKNGLGPFLRTGDLGYLKEGNLYIVGRLKNMIIIRGRNLYPNDIEQVAASSHASLDGCLGVAFAVSENTEEKLVVVQEVNRLSFKKQDSREIFRSIKKVVADTFQIDCHAILLVKASSIPRTTSGKLQHYICREMFLANTLSILADNRVSDVQSQDTSKTYPEMDTVTSSVLEYIKDLLKVSSDDIIVTESLPSHGIDSLKALRFVNWVKKSFGVNIDLESLFNDTSLQDIISIINENSTTVVACSSTVKKDIANERLPLSLNQENLWAMHRINPLDCSYNIPIVLKIVGTFDCSLFKEVIYQSFQRHGVLRTSFSSSEGVPYQIINEDVFPLLQVTDFANLDNEQKVKSIQREIEDETFTPFQLDQAPLFRIKALKLASDEIVLLLTFHHLITDGWSLNLWLEDIRRLYKTKYLNLTNVFSPQTSSYSSFSIWQRQIVNTPLFENAQNYWKNYLQGDSPILSISKFQSVKPLKNSKGSVKHFDVDGNLFGSFKAFNKMHECTTAMTLMAVLHGILHIYSGEERVQVGYPSANRSNYEFMETLGFFVNTLVSKTFFKDETTFLDLITQVKNGFLSGAKHDFFPFQELVKVLNPPRIEGVSPLFQIMFVMQNAPNSVEGFPELSIHIEKSTKLSPIYNLVLEATESEDKITLTFEYKEDCIPGFILNQFIRHYFSFLENALSGHNNKINQIPILGLEEKQQILRDWNETAVKHGNAANVIDLFEAKVKETPQASALIGQSTVWTYLELNEKANCIARHLLDAGLNRNDAVGFCLERSPLLIAVMLGIIKAGGIYVPIDPNLPVERKKYMLEDSSIKHLVLEDRFRDAFTNFSGTFVDVEALKYGDIANINQPGDLAYILYTSGSTGKPKGVVVAHSSLLNFAQAGVKLFEFTSKDRVLQFASLSWDTCSEEIYTCFAAGATLVLRSSNPVESFDELLELTNKEKITFWDLPTTYWHELTDYLTSYNKALPYSLRLLVVGGEKVLYKKVKDWEGHYGQAVRLLNTYGSTEAASISSAYDLYLWKEGMDTPIGKPIDNVRMYILNASMQPLPIGVPGELYIGGVGVAIEYRNLVELTKQKFIPDPFINNCRLYRTGDIGYYAPSGDIHLLGREDGQVKRRGYRIELEEIQKTIEEVEGVNKCLMLMQKDKASGSKMNAYIIATKSAVLEQLQTSIRAHLRVKLPEYMMPDDIFFMDEYPKLPNGKMDYKSFELKARGVEKSVCEAPFSHLEKDIIGIWKDILGHTVSSPEHSFFDVGGNSLSILKLHQKLNESFAVNINISELFSHHTVEMQARLIEKQKPTKNETLSSLELLKLLEQGGISIEEAKNKLHKMRTP